MRNIDQAQTSFQELKHIESLQGLKNAVRLNGYSSIATAGCRSACWKTFLLFETMDVASWQRVLSSSRSAYNSIRAHFLRPLENQDEVEAGYDPLNDDVEASPGLQLRKDEDLRAEILQDVTRCMPEILYFRQPDTQRMLLDILFVFCKLNPDVSYRQGMHELLAPILWVVERDAIDPGQSSKVMGEDAAITVIFDAAHIEHDTFAIFGQMMQSAKNFYEQTTTSGTENPIVNRSRRIFNELLPKVDERLAKHLETIDIVPQVFLMRWIRLLFGREFAFDQTLTMWDVIFAEDASLDIVNEICLAMLLKIRWQLLDADYNEALALLLHYPEIESEFSAQTFVVDAIYLRDHMNYHGGSFLVSKYTGRPITQRGRPTTPPVLQRNQTVVSVTSAGNRGTKSSRTSATYASTSARDINKVIQSTAKELYARGEKLGIGKAVRNAVDEVQKRAQEIRDAPTPSPPVTHRSRGSYSSLGPDALLKRVKALEDRNKGLAKLLDGAITELWAYEKAVTEQGQGGQASARSSEIENLSAAIAKAQFVQVYLDDPSLILPTGMVDDSNAAVSEPQRIANEQADDPSAFEDPLQRAPESDHAHNPGGYAYNNDVATARSNTVVTSKAAVRKPASQAPRSTPRVVADVDVSNTTFQGSRASAAGQSDSPNNTASRPRLEQSSFSWMLGDKEANSTFSAKTPAFTPERTRKKGYLFGDEAE